MIENNILLKVLCSIPIILISLYFIPFLGICLIILRYFIYSNKMILMPLLLIIIGIIILVPKFLNSLLNLIKFDVNKIPYFNDIINSSLYSADFIKYSRLLLIVGVIFLIISAIFKSLLEKLESFISLYINNQIKQDALISEKNDMIMREKRDKARDTQVVYCPYCGADNMLTQKVGTCNYCRRKIQIKD